MGWIALLIAGLAAGTALWLLGVPRSLSSFAGAALMLGATGYALQGRPTLPATPIVADAVPFEVNPGLVAFRSAILVPENESAFAQSDAALRRGDAGAAVRIMLEAVQANPRDAAAWTGLGYLFAVHDDGQVSPAAKFAFSRAIKLNPKAPGPFFFLGLAEFTAGDVDRARDAWSVALAATPANAPYRGDIESRLVMARQLAGYRRAIDAAQARPRDAGAGAR